jgi:hypothetical protein
MPFQAAVVLDHLAEPAADDIRVRRAQSQAEILRGFAEARYAAKSWDKERRIVAGSKRPVNPPHLWL